jgi:hypothetical protein
MTANRKKTAAAYREATVSSFLWAERPKAEEKRTTRNGKHEGIKAIKTDPKTTAQRTGSRLSKGGDFIETAITVRERFPRHAL